MTDKLISAGNIITGDKDLAESFNLHFSNIATKIQDSIIPTTQQPDLYLEETEFNFEMPNVTPDLIIDIVKSLKNSSSEDFEGLSSNFIKKIVPVIALPLSHIFNRSILSGVVPKELKIARVTPVFKKGGNLTDVNDYRPISLISSFSKILEKIVCNQLKDY